MQGKLVVTAPMDSARRLRFGPHYSETTVHEWLLVDVTDRAVSLLRGQLEQYGSRGRAQSLEFESEDTRGFRIDMRLNDSAWRINLSHINDLVEMTLRVTG